MATVHDDVDPAGRRDSVSSSAARNSVDSAHSGGSDSSSDGSFYEQPPADPNEVVTSAPRGRFRLGYLTTTCLPLNRMIGTGIFNTPQRVMQGTGSTGVTLLFWLAGIAYCLAGMHVYIEYGLNVPRYRIDGGPEQAVPRSGGDLNYLTYVYPWPAYRPGTILFTTCMFGITFIALGNMAGNSISFAVRALQASGVENPHPGAVRGIAIAVATFACFIHAFSRRGGLWLNNLLAGIKVGILLLIIIVAIVAGAGGLPNTKIVFEDNTKPSEAFSEASHESNGYALAFLAIIFAFGGFEQPNYVLGEISRPRRKYPVGIITGVCIAVVLYMAVNVSYMAVVPRERQINENVAQVFFELTLGSISPGSEHSKTGYRIFNALLAVSSFGNIVVMTYTAARVKQEIAKEGILPFPKFFAQNSDFSLGRLLKFLRRKGIGRSVLRWRWLSPSHHSEKTPVGALLLHLGFCVVLIFATYDLTPDSAYGLLTGVSAYAINAFFGFWLGLGILRLRIFGPPTAPTTNNTATSAANGATAAVVNGLAGNQSVAGVDAASAAAAADNNDKPHILSTMQSRQPPRPTWRQLTGGPRRGFHPWLSVLAASVYTVGNLYPLVASWVPPSTRQTALGVSEYLPWWEVPTVALCVLTAGGLWWVGWILVARYRERTRGLVFVVRRRPEFESAAEDRRQDDEEDGHVPGSSRRSQRDEGLVLVHETIFLHWVGKETLVDGSGVAAASGAVASPIPSGVDGASRRRGTVPAAPAPAAPVGRGHDGGVELVEWDHTRFTDR